MEVCFVSAALETYHETHPVLTLVWHIFSLLLVAEFRRDVGLRFAKSLGSSLSLLEVPTFASVSLTIESQAGLG